LITRFLFFMGAPFSDITLYTPSPHDDGTTEYWEDTSLKNYLSDLYVQKMYGYKPPKTTRIAIQPAFHDIWDRTWKNGSIVAIAPFYSHDEYAILDKHGKYKYILDLIQVATIQLCEEYKWDKSVFENAYQEVIENDFKFIINYPTKLSKDKKKVANLSIEKTEVLTSVYVNIIENASTTKIKLFDKKNAWWYDCVYFLVRHNKWLDINKFGIGYSKGKIDIWYSIEDNEVGIFENGNRVTEINFKKYFLFG
jgi:hypothetical protein